MGINGVDLIHNGIYKCYVSNLAGDDSISYSLKVHSPPQIITDSSALTNSVKKRVIRSVVGAPLDITCRAIGTPKPMIYWERDSLQVSNFDDDKGMFVDSMGTLRIKQLKQSDSGEYKCIAKNSAGQDTTYVDLIVQGI